MRPPEVCGLPYIHDGDLRDCRLPLNHDGDCPEANRAALAADVRTWRASDPWL